MKERNGFPSSSSCSSPSSSFSRDLGFCCSLARMTVLLYLAQELLGNLRQQVGACFLSLQLATRARFHAPGASWGTVKRGSLHAPL